MFGLLLTTKEPPKSHQPTTENAKINDAVHYIHCLVVDSVELSRIVDFHVIPLLQALTVAEVLPPAYGCYHCKLSQCLEHALPEYVLCCAFIWRLFIQVIGGRVCSIDLFDDGRSVALRSMEPNDSGVSTKWTMIRARDDIWHLVLYDLSPTVQKKI